jgi:hypothetical protein
MIRIMIKVRRGPKIDLPVAEEAGGIPPGQTESNSVKPEKEI